MVRCNKLRNRQQGRAMTMTNISVQRLSTALPRSDGLSAIASLRDHWPEYLMELGGRGCYLFGACVFATVLQHPVSDSTTDCRSNPIAHRVRRKRQRLPPSLLIENASDRDPARPQNLPEAFPIKASDHLLGGCRCRGWECTRETSSIVIVWLASGLPSVSRQFPIGI